MSETPGFSKPGSEADEIKRILKTAKTIAVVGLSDKPDRPSHAVASYLKANGFRIIPVNPAIKAAEVLGEKVYARLEDIPGPVDIVDVFRKSEDVLPIAESAVKIKAKFLWMQEGIVNPDAAEAARKAGITVVMDKCILKEHLKIKGIGRSI